VRTLRTLIAAKKVPAPRLTIHFMWVPEYLDTLAYVTNHPEARSGNRRHTAAKAGTKGCSRAFRRAFDSQPRDRFGSSVWCPAP